MSTYYIEQAEQLVSAVSQLQRRVLVQHTVALLEELHSEIQALNAEIDSLRNLMKEAADDFHGKSVLFSSPFVSEAYRNVDRCATDAHNS